MKSNRNIFLTGKAGTGKSYIINEYMKWATEKRLRVALTASTGIASLNIRGSTIHSFIGSRGMKSIDEYKDFINKVGISNVASIYEHIAKHDVVIIDEVSMLNANMIDLIDYIFKFAKDSADPFGGIKMIFVGDFFQLPPPGKERSDKKLAFKSHAWKNANIHIHNLHKVYRQKDQEFIKILSNIRHGDRRRYINEYFKDVQLRGDEYLEDHLGYVRLCATNSTVNRYNELYLDMFKEDGHTYEFTHIGEARHWKELLKSSLVEETLVLKQGARVMFITNDKEGRYVNGSMGEIIRLNHNIIIVKLDSGNLISIKQYVWTSRDRAGNVIAKIKQFPIRLAFAITIHKSQGMTLDKVIVDCEDIFEEGQLYTALSRCKSKEGLLLDGLDIFHQNKVNRWVVRFYKELDEIDQEIIDDIQEVNVYGFVKRRKGIKV